MYACKMIFILYNFLSDSNGTKKYICVTHRIGAPIDRSNRLQGKEKSVIELINV